MNILKALHQEEKKLESRLSAIQGAIEVLNGRGGNGRRGNGRRRGRHAGWHMSAAAKAKISKAQKERWAKQK